MRQHPTRALAATLTAAALLLVGCSPAPQQGAANAPGTSPSSGSPATGAASAPAESARADQRAAASAAARAGSFGFTTQAAATEEAIAQTREQAQLRQTNTAGTTVTPSECKAPLTALDWSPILLPDADVSRTDFGSEGFAGTGSVEVAAVQDGEPVEQHVANVRHLVTDCPELQMTVTEDGGGQTTYDFTVEATSETGAEAVDSQMVWQRTEANGEGESTVAQVALGQSDGHVVMVSFIGGADVADEEFTTMSEEILAAALGDL